MRADKGLRHRCDRGQLGEWRRGDVDIGFAVGQGVAGAELELARQCGPIELRARALDAITVARVPDLRRVVLVRIEKEVADLMRAQALERVERAEGEAVLDCV